MPTAIKTLITLAHVIHVDETSSNINGTGVAARGIHREADHPVSSCPRRPATVGR
jgi:hypothetical protein